MTTSHEIACGKYEAEGRQIEADWEREQNGVKGGQGDGAESQYTLACMTAYAIGAISAIILAGCLISSALQSIQ